MSMLANLTTSDNPAMNMISEGLKRTGYAVPGAFCVFLGVLLALAGAYALWRWRRREMLQPGPRTLLRRVADALELPPEHRRLLWRLARQAGLEPAAALVSPQLLMQLVHDSEAAGLPLTGEERTEIASILDVVSAASS